MWDTDAVTLQTKGTKTKIRGAVKIPWDDDSVVLCDVQDVSREFVFKSYGLTEKGEYKQVFDKTLNPGWAVGNQVKYDNQQWWVKYVNGNMGKMGLSNHVFFILMKVI